MADLKNLRVLLPAYVAGTKAFRTERIMCDLNSVGEKESRRGRVVAGSRRAVVAELRLRSDSGDCCGNAPSKATNGEDYFLTRRLAVSTLIAGAAALSGALPGDQPAALAIATTATPGRVPGLSQPDENGLRTYSRPEGKSGGHGVGWSELIPYSFKVTEDWEEVPVSIADLGGTEIDLRFSNPKAGNISIVVAPVQRFSDRLGNDVKIQDIGTPERVIYAFGPELTGRTVEGSVLDMVVVAHEGRTYYQYELAPHVLVSATAAGNRMYIMTLTASSRQWKKYEKDARGIVQSFRVA